MVDAAWFLVNIVGNIGVAFILIAYFALTVQAISSESIRYSLLNLFGAVFIGVSLFFEFNLPSAIIEACWTVIALFGLGKALFRRYRNRNNTTDNTDNATEKSAQTSSSQPDTTREPPGVQDQPADTITQADKQVERANIV